MPKQLPCFAKLNESIIKITGRLVLLAPLAGAALSTVGTHAATITMTTNDDLNSTSFNTGLHWSNGLPPTAGNNYVSAFTLRTPPNGGNYTFAGDSLTINSGGTLAFKGFNGDTITVNNLVLDNGNIGAFAGGGPTFTIAGTITLGAGGGLFNTGLGNRTTSVTAPISGSAGVLLYNGGIVQLSHANSYAGDTVINSSFLRLSDPNAVQNSTIRLDADNELTFGTGIGTFNVGGLSSNSRITLSDTGGNAVTVKVGGNGQSTTLGGVIGGNGALTKVGSGTLMLTANNTYSGGTTISGGTLQLGDGTANNGSVSNDIVDNSALVFNNPSSQTFGGVISSSGSVTKSGTGTLTLTGFHMFTGGLTVNNGIVALDSPGSFAVPAACPVTVNSGGELDINQTDNIYGSPMTVNGVVNITGGGHQHLVLLALNGGTIATSGSSFAYDGQGNYALDGSTTNVGGTSHSTLAASTGIHLNSSPTFNVASTGDAAGDLIVSASLRNHEGNQAAGFTKVGPGKMVLTGNSTFTGSTVISGGTLSLVTATSNNISTSQSIDVAAGANLDVTGVSGSGGFALAQSQILKGIGTVLGSVQLGSGSHLAPGESVGTLTVSALNLAPGSILDYEFNSSPANDLANVTSVNGLTINGGGFNLYIEGTTNPFSTPGTYHLLNYVGTLQGSGVSALSVLNPQQGETYTFSNNTALSEIDLRIAPVPEPSSVVLAGLGGLAIVACSHLSKKRRRCPMDRYDQRLRA